jgi:HAMP domain-containing protein
MTISATGNTKPRKPPFVFRPNLLLQILLNGVIPIVLFTITYLIFSSRSSTAYFERLIQDSARQVAISVGSTVKRENFSELGDQLASLTDQPNIAFVYVRSQVAEEWRVKPSLGEGIDKSVIKALYDFTNQHSQQGLRWSDDQAGYRSISDFYAKRFNGQLPSAIGQSFQTKTAASVGRASNTIQIEQLGVYESGSSRTFGAADESKADFTIMVGMNINQNVIAINEQNRNLILAGLAFCVISILFSSLIARGITRPIVNLIRSADAMSLGNLETPIHAAGGQEIRTLAEALERVRVSLTVLIKHAKRKER